MATIYLICNFCANTDYASHELGGCLMDYDNGRIKNPTVEVLGSVFQIERKKRSIMDYRPDGHRSAISSIVVTKFIKFTWNSSCGFCSSRRL